MPTYSLTDSITITIDDVGWPAVVFDTVTSRATWQLLPMTWWEIEDLLAEFGPREPGMDLQESYRGMCQAAGRPALGAIGRGGEPVSPSIAVRGAIGREAEAVARAVGPQWRLPSPTEWVSMYKLATAHTQPISPSGVMGRIDDLVIRPLARAVCEYLLRSTSPTTLAQLMLLHGNGVDWVYLDRGRYGGRGRQQQPDGSFLATPLGGTVRLRSDAREERMTEIRIRAIKAEEK